MVTQNTTSTAPAGQNSGTNLRDSKGRLTAYALACGYVEQKTIGDVDVSLWMEHGCCHCRAHSDALGRIFWESGKLSDMRRIFARAHIRLTR